eukprot:09135.XXX_266727_266906_1 [CDS] Oithona nana genome sequencing.
MTVTETTEPSIFRFRQFFTISICNHFLTIQNLSLFQFGCVALIFSPMMQISPLVNFTVG